VLIETSSSPRELLDVLLRVERSLGRVRDGTRWGPRMLDLDLLACADLQLDEPGLVLPHPQLERRAFVLVPLAEIAPGAMVPGSGRVADLVKNVDASGMIRLPRT
jgi:2-amino-4-hydroxy-6-hydroxymethyldihydropteridine diphosphokinase